MKEYF
jgi:hypothetical protein